MNNDEDDNNKRQKFDEEVDYKKLYEDLLLWSKDFKLCGRNIQLFLGGDFKFLCHEVNILNGLHFEIQC